MAARVALLFVAAVLALLVMAAVSPDLASSGQRVGVAAVVALLAPLLWPGLAHTPEGSALRVLAWSAAGAVSVPVSVSLFAQVAGASLQLMNQLLPLLSTGLCLFAVLLLTHAGQALLEARGRHAGRPAATARLDAAHAVALLLALLGSAPLWLGPMAEVLAPAHDWTLNAVVGASPLTHLAVASGNDVLRNPWLYQHANLAALPVDYPALGAITRFYASACAGVVLAALATFALRRRTPIPLIKENTP